VNYIEFKKTFLETIKKTTETHGAHQYQIPFYNAKMLDLLELEFPILKDNGQNITITNHDDFSKSIQGHAGELRKEHGSKHSDATPNSKAYKSFRAVFMLNENVIQRTPGYLKLEKNLTEATTFFEKFNKISIDKVHLRSELMKKIVGALSAVILQALDGDADKKFCPEFLFEQQENIDHIITEINKLKDPVLFTNCKIYFKDMNDKITANSIYNIRKIAPDLPKLDSFSSAIYSSNAPDPTEIRNIVKIFGGSAKVKKEITGNQNVYLSFPDAETAQAMSAALAHFGILGKNGKPKYVKDHYGDNTQGIILTYNDIIKIEPFNKNTIISLCAIYKTVNPETTRVLIPDETLDKQFFVNFLEKRDEAQQYSIQLAAKRGIVGSKGNAKHVAEHYKSNGKSGYGVILTQENINKLIESFSVQHKHASSPDT
jgi:hypothetical protein